jgi:hypothetical protein
MSEREQRGLDDLLSIMRDQSVKARDRLNAAVSASRVSALAMPGDEAPEAVKYLRYIIDYMKDGIQFPAAWRREAASAVSYYERRAAKNALQFQVTDTAEQNREWRALLNGVLRRHLWHAKRWPRDRAVLFAVDEALPAMPCDPSLALTALMLPFDRHSRRARRKGLDEPDMVAITSEEQRRDILRAIARCMHRRLSEFADGDRPTAA